MYAKLCSRTLTHQLSIAPYNNTFCSKERRWTLTNVQKYPSNQSCKHDNRQFFYGNKTENESHFPLFRMRNCVQRGSRTHNTPQIWKCLCRKISGFETHCVQTFSHCALLVSKFWQNFDAFSFGTKICANTLNESITDIYSNSNNDWYSQSNSSIHQKKPLIYWQIRWRLRWRANSNLDWKSWLRISRTNEANEQSCSLLYSSKRHTVVHVYTK